MIWGGRLTDGEKATQIRKNGPGVWFRQALEDVVSAHNLRRHVAFRRLLSSDQFLQTLISFTKCLLLRSFSFTCPPILSLVAAWPRR
ncbi:hypothetical protein L2E82_45519 [Cichorium intybus]|uniref:Uncharacterized protein n=1 Tax=Cichorium intybus TaxID=13427 RepID=A0ACB8ZUJ6_CICIN|nr:hypothetical protein L2E82_45519 [Cichorium intybus]